MILAKNKTLLKRISQTTLESFDKKDISKEDKLKLVIKELLPVFNFIDLKEFEELTTAINKLNGKRSNNISTSNKKI